MKSSCPWRYAESGRLSPVLADWQGSLPGGWNHDGCGTLAITEYLDEKHAHVWPADPVSRAWARSAAAEMHSGFQALRNICGMNCGVRIRLHSVDATLARDLQRLEQLWADGFARFGGPFLAGAAFSAADAFFAPVAMRIQTYDPPLGEAARRYAARLRELPAMKQWYEAALAETWRDEEHEVELRAVGTWTQDLRAKWLANVLALRRS